ncbi:MAG: tetratricopeptide repeat protein [Myxococcota bacterium]
MTTDGTLSRARGRRDRLLRGLVAAASVGIAACGGDKPAVNAPPGGAYGGPGAPPGNPMTPAAPGAPQMGAVDQTPDGAPRMNAAAAAAYQQAMTQWAAGDLQGAKASFIQATQADGRAFQAYYSLGVIQERLGEAGALASYRKSFEIVPKYERGMVAYGVLLAKRDRLSDADRFFVERRAEMSKSAALAAGHAEVKSLQKDTAGAQELARSALKLDPTYAPAMMVIARDHYRNRRLDLSLYALKAIVDGFGPDNPARDPDNAEAHLLRANIFVEQDLRSLAMGAYRKALGLRPDLVGARVKLATYMLQAGSATEALPELQTALRFDPDNLDIRLALGDAYRLTGDYGQAQKEFEWVKGRDSSLPQVYYNLGLLFLFAEQMPGMSEKARMVAAISNFEKYKELRSKNDQSDVDELQSRAELKKAEIEALEKVDPAPPPPPAAGGGS